MTNQPRTRQELYDRIREIGREGFILEEMIRYGFWPAQGEIPNDPADEIRRRGEIESELAELRKQSYHLQNEKYLRQQMLQERLAESRRKRQETKERREKQRQERAANWQQRKQQEIIYLGENLGKNVSGGLNHFECDRERLASYNLPILTNGVEMAQAMGISIGEIRFLAFARTTATTCHYIRFKIPKKTGGERLISAPLPRLKKAQHWILTNILEKITLHHAAHGFRADHSIVSNATPHVGAAVVINFDLKDFFPSISHQRVKGLFKSFGYSEAVATIFSLICTAPDIEAVELDGQTYYVATTERHLPQGSPASPAISNLICRRFDQRLETMANELGFVYTRYADDLTFSTPTDNRHICNLLKRTESIVNHEGLTLNREKLRIMRKKSSRLEVTGVVVNERLSLSRQELKKFRATLYQIEKDGIEGKKWGNSDNVLAAIQGYANFVAMVNPEKGAEFLAQIKRIKDKYQS